MSLVERSKSIQMYSNDYTHLVDGKRQWTNLGLDHLRDASKIEDNFVRFNALKGILTQSLNECGNFKKKEETLELCKWTINTQGWVCNVILHTSKQHGKGVLLLRVGEGVPPCRPEKDLFPLWGIIRESWGGL